jgi:hypothetical protein
MSDYQAIFYGIHRTHIMKSIQEPLDRVKSLWAKELLTSSLALMAGGMYRAPRYYMARNTTIATEGWHPQQFAIDPAELSTNTGPIVRSCSSTWRPMPSVGRLISPNSCGEFSTSCT